MAATGITTALNGEGQKVTSVLASSRTEDGSMELSYTDTKLVGNGSFGVVYQIMLANGEPAAIKKVLQDKRFKV